MVEGAKNVQELLFSDFEIHSIYCTEPFLHENSNQINLVAPPVFKSEPEQLANAGTFQSNKSALAIAKIKSSLIKLF